MRIASWAFAPVAVVVAACGSPEPLAPSARAPRHASAPDSDASDDGATLSARLDAGAACSATRRDECSSALFCDCATHTCIPVQGPGAPCYAPDECASFNCTIQRTEFYDCAADAGPPGTCMNE